MRKHGCLVGYGVERIGVNDAAGAFEDEAVELGVHRHLARLLPRRGAIDPLVFFGPRMINGALFGYDMRAKYLGWRVSEMLQYSMNRKLRGRSMGLSSVVDQDGHTPGSKLNFLLMRNRRRADRTETVIPGGGLMSRLKRERREAWASRQAP